MNAPQARQLAEFLAGLEKLTQETGVVIEFSGDAARLATGKTAADVVDLGAITNVTGRRSPANDQGSPYYEVNL